MDTLGFYRSERAYTNRKTDLRYGAAKQQATPVIAEKSYAIPGVNRFISIVIRPYLTVDEASDGLESFAQTIRTRYSWVGTSSVTDSDVELPNLTNARLVETHAAYNGMEFRILGMACLVDKELLIFEFQCAANSQWNPNDCESVVLRQIAKLERWNEETVEF